MDILLSYAFHSARALEIVRPNADLVMMDSGAYTAYRNGKRISLDGYAAFLGDTKGVWDYAITLDVVGDVVATTHNTQRLHAMGIPVMPVFHVGSPLAEFRAMVKDAPYVAAGGMWPLKQSSMRERYLAMLVAEAGDDAAVHALGVGAASVIRRSGVHSADSSAVSNAPRNGAVVVWDGKGEAKQAGLQDATSWQALAGMRKYGFPAGKVAAGGRWMPGLREEMWSASLAAVARRWEKTREDMGSPHPALGGEVGPRYYNSMTTEEGVRAVALGAK